MLLDVLVSIYYICSFVEVLPALFRIIKRKSSTDYSIASTLILTVGMISWSAYIYLTEQTVAVYAGTTLDLIIMLCYAFIVIKYHK